MVDKRGQHPFTSKIVRVRSSKDNFPNEMRGKNLLYRYFFFVFVLTISINKYLLGKFIVKLIELLRKKKRNVSLNYRQIVDNCQTRGSEDVISLPELFSINWTVLNDFLVYSAKIIIS